MSRSSKVRKFSCRVLDFRYIFLIFRINQFTRKGLLKKSQGSSHFESTFWPRYAGLVAGIHCRGEDLAFFPPRRIFSTTNVYICSENAAHIGGFYFMRLATSEGRVSDFIVLFIFTSVGKCKVKEPTTLTEVRIEVLRANVRGTQREYSSKQLKHSIVKRILVFKSRYRHIFIP